jgi:hypothetical protein
MDVIGRIAPVTDVIGCTASTGGMPVATEVLGDPGLRAISNSDKAPRTIFGLGERRSNAVLPQDRDA